MGQNDFILTGTPGTGKTTLLQELAKKGFATCEEMTRKVLEEQLAVDGPALPAKDPRLFIQTTLDLAIEQFETLGNRSRPVIFDRGIPDVLAYGIRFDVAQPQDEEVAAQHRYASQVFVLPVWREIFTHDKIRRLSFETAVVFDALLRQTYARLGYTLIEVPRVSPQERANFVLGIIGP